MSSSSLFSLLCCLGMILYANAWVQPTTTTTTKYYRNRCPSLSASTSYTLDGEDIRGPITPVGNYILVKTKDAMTSTYGGILLPDQAKERPSEGKVLAAGPGKLHPHTGIRIHNPIKTGHSVVYGKFDGTSVNYNDEVCQMIRDDDVLCYYQGVALTLDNVIPCRDYVFVQLKEMMKETESGIQVTSAAQKDAMPCEGTVLKVGEGRLASNGEFTPSPVQVGDEVKFKDYAGNDVEISGKEYSLVRMVDILCTKKALPEEATAAEGEG